MLCFLSLQKLENVMLKSWSTEQEQTKPRFPLKKGLYLRADTLLQLKAQDGAAGLLRIVYLPICFVCSMQYSKFKINSNRCIPALKLHRKILPVVTIPFCHIAAVGTFWDDLSSHQWETSGSLRLLCSILQVSALNSVTAGNNKAFQFSSLDYPGGKRSSSDCQRFCIQYD